MGRGLGAPAGTFGALLRGLRTAAGLTQEGLAAAASLSPRSVSDLERGINLTARRETARLLADALRLTGPGRAQFEAMALGAGAGGGAAAAGPLAGVAGATRTLPPDTGAFTGRESELRRLVAAASGADTGGGAGVISIYAIGGMAGIGKTTLAVHAAHRLAPEFPDGQVFLPLHGHTPGQRPVHAADALASLLLTAGVSASRIPAGLEERAGLWRDQVAGKRLLLILDDAAGHEQVRPLLPGAAGSLVLVTSRRHLTALEDAHAISLDTLPPDEASDLLIRRAARPGLTAGDPAVAQITRLCGYLPLAIGMLARQLHHHPAWTAAEVAAELATTRDRLGLMRTENLSVAAAFDLSYQDLAPGQQRLFRRLGLHPGSDIDGYAAAALDGTGLAAARHGLDALYDQHLLTETARGRYRLHDLMREHAAALAAADPPADTAAAADRLLAYYGRAAQLADGHLARHARPAPGSAAPGSPAPGSPAPGSPAPDSIAPDSIAPDSIAPDSIAPDSSAPDSPAPDSPVAGGPAVPPVLPELDGRSAAVAWMDRERLNLHAAASAAAARGQLGPAAALAAALHAYLRFRGHWDQAAALHASALDWAARASDRCAEATALAHLGDLQIATRATRLAVTSLSRAVELFRDLGDRPGEAGALTDLGAAQYLTGDNQAATATLTQALGLSRELGDPLGQAIVLSRLGSVQLVTGDYPAATAGLTAALARYRELGDELGEAHALTDLGAVGQATGDYPAAARALGRALELYQQLGDRLGEANARCVLSAVQQATGDHPAATAGLIRARELFRALGDRLGRANVLALLGGVQQETGDLAGAAASQAQALELYRELGDRAGEAEALINVGALHLAGADPAAAREQFEAALAIAADIAWPLGQAHAQAGLGRCAAAQGQPGPAATALRHALAIYQRIGAPDAREVADQLAELNA